MMEKIIGGIWGLVACGLLTLLLGGCGAHRTLQAERVRHDTVWMVSAGQTARSDSVVVRERVEIVPKLIRLGDTTILHRDTTIVRVVERNVVSNRSFYTDSGRIVRDTAKASREASPSPSKGKASPSPSKGGGVIWALGLLGLGALIGLGALLLLRRH